MTKIIKLNTIISIFLLAGLQVFSQNSKYILKSPDNQLTVTVTNCDNFQFSISDNKGLIISPSNIGIKLVSGEQWGDGDKIKKSETQSIKEIIPSPFYKKTQIESKYNQLKLIFDEYLIEFRAYNDGVAYRFESLRKKPFVIKNEIASFNFPKDYNLYAPYVSPNIKGKSERFEKQFFSSHENVYTHAPISTFNSDSLLFLPLMVELEHGRKMNITEVNLENYPGMYLINSSTESTNLSGVFAPYPKMEKQGGHNMLQVLVAESEDYIAKVDGKRTFPWRVFGIVQTDTDILTSDLVYELADESRIKDLSWIKPGKVAWEWWNACNISGVDFKSGVNTDTYKYYIDFASKFGIEYVILDEGWAVNKKADMFDIIPEIDLNEIIGYATTKGVGIILWAGYYAFDRDMVNICSHYQKMGVKGFKIDFMDRDDQLMTNFIYRASSICAQYNLIVDFHGIYKPTGLLRTYPNVLNNEGVHGLETLKNHCPDQVLYDVTMPFIRMFAGPLDYTQGAMRNATKNNFRAIYSEPMSQGTRCRQLAQYVIFESPINMLCDNPTNYMKEPLCTKFIANIPMIWDETIVLSGEISKYLVIARRNHENWYVGGMTDWNEREVLLDLSFLPDGQYSVELFRDGINADKVASDFKFEVIQLQSEKKLSVIMAPGGGFVARISKI